MDGAPATEEEDMAKTKGADAQATDRVFTLPNLISVVRLCLVPVYLVLLFNGFDVMAACMFALAAGTARIRCPSLASYSILRLIASS